MRCLDIDSCLLTLNMPVEARSPGHLFRRVLGRRPLLQRGPARSAWLARGRPAPGQRAAGRATDAPAEADRAVSSAADVEFGCFAWAAKFQEFLPRLRHILAVPSGPSGG